jgi:hypothetical protein
MYWYLLVRERHRQWTDNVRMDQLTWGGCAAEAGTERQLVGLTRAAGAAHIVGLRQNWNAICMLVHLHKVAHVDVGKPLVPPRRIAFEGYSLNEE